MRPSLLPAAVNAEVVAALEELSRDSPSAITPDAVRPPTAHGSLGEAAHAIERAQRSAAERIEEIKRILTLQTDRGLYLALAELRIATR